MSGADDLRNEFAQTLAVFDGYDDEPEESIAADYLARANDLLELIADPELRLAILGAMGLDVTEGRGSQDEEAIWTIGPPDGLDLPGDLDVLVVRPRGEATDA